MRTIPVIVGADGTDSGKAAVRWAAHEAQRTGRPLQVIHVFDWAWREARHDTSIDYLNLVRTRAAGVTANAVHEARAAAPRLEIQGNQLIGDAAARLLGESKYAALMVLGSRGRGGFAGLLLGSVSRRVATHAACPVVVVRGRRDVTRGPVAAGVDDSPAADRVLEVAFDAAYGRGCPLVVVRAFRPAIPLWLTNVRAIDVETPEADATERMRLAEQLAPWRQKFPGVPVDVVLTHGSAAAALVDASTRAQLVVVGSHGRGAITGAVLGSVGLQLLHHAACPVYITRASAR